MRHLALVLLDLMGLICVLEILARSLEECCFVMGERSISLRSIHEI